MKCQSLRIGLLLPWMFLIAIRGERPNFRLDYRYEKAFHSFYKLHITASNWQEARVRCQAEGAEMLVPDSMDEADTIPVMITQLPHKFEGIFVGIHDLYSERVFVTLKGTPMLTGILNLLWEYREPTHSAGRCVAMRRSGKLFVAPCDTTLPYMCRVKADELVYHEECDTFDPRWEKLLNSSNSCYFMHKEPQNWHTAYATCLAAGGHLAIINNKQEADFFKQVFKNTENKRSPENDFAYLGFSDLFIRYHFRTIHGQPVDELGYKEWEQMRCRDDNLTLSDFRCGGFRRTGLLSSWPCDIPAMFFCEKPLNETESTVQDNDEKGQIDVNDETKTANSPLSTKAVSTVKAETTIAKTTQAETTKAKTTQAVTTKAETTKAKTTKAEKKVETTKDETKTTKHKKKN